MKHFFELIPHFNGLFTRAVTNTETEIQIVKMGKDPNGYLCSYLSLCSVTTSLGSAQAIRIGLDVGQ